MKILFASNPMDILNSGGFINDYLNDLLFHGLNEIDDIEVTSASPIVHLYTGHKNDINPEILWGKGFTSAFLLTGKAPTISQSSLTTKILDKYFDYIIYGSCLRSLPLYDLVFKTYDPKRIIMIDGADSSTINMKLYHIHPYFKREINSDSNTALIPIHFAIPSSKIRSFNQNKDQIFSKSIPGLPYLFNSENEYYDDYYRSSIGITTKKAGWDCMRHYEIMANSCIPLFYNIDQCPNLTMTNMPKDLLKECLSSLKNQNQLDSLRLSLYDYTRKFLTTKQLAKYVLEKIVI